MKNLLDLLDISTNEIDIDIEIVLSPIIDNGYPSAIVLVNDNILFNDVLSVKTTLTFSIPLLSSTNISVEMLNKKYSELQETAIIIEKLSIDKFELIPNYNHHFVYKNEHNNGSPTNYLGVNGKWSLDIEEPFYMWKHNILGNGWLLIP